MIENPAPLIIGPLRQRPGEFYALSNIIIGFSSLSSKFQSYPVHPLDIVHV